MDKRNLLLISNSTMRGEAYLGWCKDMIADFCKRHNVKRVLFVPYAGVSLAQGGLTKSYDAYEAKVAAVYKEFGVKLTSVHHKALPINALYDTDCVAVGGGNTFHLVRELQRTGLMQAFNNKGDYIPNNKKIEKTSFACAEISNNNHIICHDNEVVHYTDFFDPKHGGETRDDRLKEYIMVNPKATVAAIREATALLLEDGRLSLIGKNNKMKVFKTTMENTKEYSLKDNISFLLKA